MKEKEILQTIKMLANSQGFYGRLYRDLMEMKNSDNEIDNANYYECIEELEKQNFKDGVDLVLYLET